MALEVKSRISRVVQEGQYMVGGASLFHLLRDFLVN